MRVSLYIVEKKSRWWLRDKMQRLKGRFHNSDCFLYPKLKEKNPIFLFQSSNCQSLIWIFTADNALEIQPPTTTKQLDISTHIFVSEQTLCQIYNYSTNKQLQFCARLGRLTQKHKCISSTYWPLSTDVNKSLLRCRLNTNKVSQTLQPAPVQHCTTWAFKIKLPCRKVGEVIELMLTRLLNRCHES